MDGAHSLEGWIGDDLVFDEEFLEFLVMMLCRQGYGTLDTLFYMKL